MTLTTIPAVIALTFAMAPTPVSQATQTDRDLKEVLSYRLSMDVMRKLGTIYKVMAEEAQKDPAYQKRAALQAELKALGDKEELTDAESDRMTALSEQIQQLEEEADDESPLGDDEGQAQTLTDMASRIERVPAAAAAVRKAGMTPREFATAQLALFQSMMAYGFSKAGTIKELPAGVSKENVEFLRTHEEEIKALTAEWEKFKD